MPDCVKILVNECNTLGETLMRHTLHRFGVGDGNGKIMITLKNLMAVIKMFHYNCSQVDQNELRFWVLNNQLIIDAPQHFREDVIFLDTGKLLK